MLDEAFEQSAAAAHLMIGFDRPWCIAGGWAIDLAVERVTRQHRDLEIALFRQDQHALRNHLPDWQCFHIANGQPIKWYLRDILQPPVHEIHATSRDGWKLKFLLNECDAIDWIYRRDQRVRRALEKTIVRGAAGIPVLAPEIVLLYKSKNPRPQDELDFRVAREMLDDESRGWLIDALRTTAPAHPWLKILGG